MDLRPVQTNTSKLSHFFSVRKNPQEDYQFLSRPQGSLFIDTWVQGLLELPSRALRHGYEANAFSLEHNKNVPASEIFNCCEKLSHIITPTLNLQSSIRKPQRGTPGQISKKKVFEHQQKYLDFLCLEISQDKLLKHNFFEYLNLTFMQRLCSHWALLKGNILAHSKYSLLAHETLKKLSSLVSDTTEVFQSSSDFQIQPARDLLNFESRLFDQLLTQLLFAEASY